MRRYSSHTESVNFYQCWWLLLVSSHTLKGLSDAYTDTGISQTTPDLETLLHDYEPTHRFEINKFRVAVEWRAVWYQRPHIWLYLVKILLKYVMLNVGRQTDKVTELCGWHTEKLSNFPEYWLDYFRPLQKNNNNKQTTNLKQKSGVKLAQHKLTLLQDCQCQDCDQTQTDSKDYVRSYWQSKN